MRNIKLENVKSKKLLKQKPDIFLYSKEVMITTGEKWYKRIWHFFINPFIYLFVGRIKY